MSGDHCGERKRRAENREEHAGEETERDTDEKEDKRQDEWLGHLEFPKKLREEDSIAVRHFTDSRVMSRIMSNNIFLTEQALNEVVVAACFQTIGIKGYSHTEKLRRAMLWTDCRNMIAERMSHRRSLAIEKFEILFHGKTNKNITSSDQHELIFNVCFFQQRQGMRHMRKSQMVSVQRI
jgi:hypothetical protein